MICRYLERDSWELLLRGSSSSPSTYSQILTLLVLSHHAWRTSLKQGISTKIKRPMFQNSWLPACWIVSCLFDNLYFVHDIDLFHLETLVPHYWLLCDNKTSLFIGNAHQSLLFVHHLYFRELAVTIVGNLRTLVRLIAINSSF